MGVASTIGSIAGVAGTIAAVVATGPLSAPAVIAGSRLLATTFIVGGGITGATTGWNICKTITDRLSRFKRQRIDKVVKEEKQSEMNKMLRGVYILSPKL